jgi:hypothetical protein
MGRRIASCHDRAVARSVGGPASAHYPVGLRRAPRTARRYWVSGAIAKLLGRFGLFTVIKRMERNPSSSRGVPVRRSPERYVGRQELAEIMGVSLATVDRLVAKGMPSVTWGRRTRRFRPSAAISWASERDRAA